MWHLAVRVTREKWLLNWINSTSEQKQAAQQVLVVLKRSFHVYYHSKTAAALNLEFGLVRSRSFIVNSLKNYRAEQFCSVEQNFIDRAEQFSPMKTTSKDKKLCEFHRILKIRSCRKVVTKIIAVRITVKFWTLSSVAIVEAHKSRSRVDTNCYKNKTKQKEWLWSDLWPRARPPQLHVLAYLRFR